MKHSHYDVITPPNYSGQTDNGLFIVLNHVERGVTVAGFWDERNGFGKTVESDEYAGLVCLRLDDVNKSFVPQQYHHNSQLHELCIWRNHPNVRKYEQDEYVQARVFVRAHEFLRGLRFEKQTAETNLARAVGKLAAIEKGAL